MLPGLYRNFISWRDLPAPIATATAIPAITVPASSATATSATASAARPSATTTAIAATASTSSTAAGPSSSATTSAFTRRASFVDDNITAHEIVAIQSLNGALGFLVAIHFHKSESARLP
jgi:hypothetical protein